MRVGTTAGGTPPVTLQIWSITHNPTPNKAGQLTSTINFWSETLGGEQLFTFIATEAVIEKGLVDNDYITVAKLTRGATVPAGTPYTAKDGRTGTSTNDRTICQIETLLSKKAGKARSGLSTL